MGTYRISGAVGWLLILATHCTVALAAPSTRHGYETKSIAQAYLECLQYLNITGQSIYAYNTAAVPPNTGGNCLLRCIGLNTRWWNDETGLNENALMRFFHQADPNSLDQARTCLASDSDSSDSCAAAYRSFRCYSDVLGEVIAHPAYVAPCREEIRRAVGDCAAMLQVSDEQLTACVVAETFQHSANTTALLRCVVLRLGLYADTTGVMCDRVQLLMDSDTAQTWTEAHAQEAKRCENDLRVLGADVCLVAAHSVEICYGWMAFGELWKVLRDEYGSSDDVILYDHTEEFPVESNDAAEEEANNEIHPAPIEVEVFSYPSSSRYRSLLIVAHKAVADDSNPDSSDSSSSEDEMTPNGGKLETHEPAETHAEKPINSDNAVKQQATVPEPEEKTEPETEHIVITRSVMHPMAPELFPYSRAALPPYVLRMRRSIPLPHYHPHAHADIPFVPVRFVREVDSTVPHAALGDDLTEPIASQAQQDVLDSLMEKDATISENEELGTEASSDGEHLPTGEDVEGLAYEEPVLPTVNDYSSKSVADETLNDAGIVYVETEPVSPSNVAEDVNNDETGVNGGDYYKDENSDVIVNSAIPVAESDDLGGIEGAASASEIPQDSVQPEVTDESPRSETSNTLAPGVHPHTLHQLQFTLPA